MINSPFSGDIVKDEVIPWTVISGRITQVKINEDIFCLKDNYPENVDILEVIRSFARVVDVGKTMLIRKTFAKQEKIEKPTDEESLIKLYGIKIIKNVVIDLYNYLPEKFSSDNVFKFFKTNNSELAEVSIINKKNAYLKYMKDNGYIKQIEKIKHYRKVKAPFESVKPDDIDTKWLNESRMLEMQSMRKG